MLVDDVIGVYSGYASLAGLLGVTLTLAGMAYRRRSPILSVLSLLTLLSLVLAITLLPVIVRFNRILGYGSALLVALAWLLLWLRIEAVYALVGSRFGIKFITLDRANVKFIEDLNRRLLEVARQIYATLGPDSARLEVKEIGRAGGSFFEIQLTPRNLQAAAVVLRLFNEVTLLIGPHRAVVELGDYLEGGVFDGAELGRQTINAVVGGHYSERIQRLHASPITAVAGRLQVAGRTLATTRGMFLPFLKTTVRRYQPYKATP
jgi:hypothetical protein